MKKAEVTEQMIQELLTAVEQYSLNKSDHAKQEINSLLKKYKLLEYKKDGGISVTYVAAQLEKQYGEKLRLKSLLDRYLKQETQDVVDFIKAADYSGVLYQEITRFKLFYFSIHHKKDIDEINAEIIKVLEKHHLSFFEDGGKVQNFKKSGSLINKQDIREIIQKKYNDEKLLTCLREGNAADINTRLKDLFNLEHIQEQTITMSNVKEHVRKMFYKVYKEIAQIIVQKVNVDKILENILRAQLKSGFNALGITDDFGMQSVTAEKIKQHILTNKLKLVQKYITDADPDLKRKANKIYTSSNAESLSKIFSSFPKILSVAYSNAIDEAGEDIRLEVMDEYRDFLSEAEHIREISNRVSKEVPHRLDKALHAIVSNQQYQETILNVAKSYATLKLAMNIDVSSSDDNTDKFLVIVKTLSRKSGSKAEHNHTVPVSVFLTALKHMLESKEFSSGDDLLEHVKDFYGQDYKNNPYYMSVKSYIANISKQEECKKYWTPLLAEQITGSIYQNWNERPYATYVEKREQTQYSAEGKHIKNLNIALNDLCAPKKKNIQQDSLNALYNKYFEAIDIKIQDDFDTLYHVVKDSIWLARIILKIFQSKDHKNKVIANYEKNHVLFDLLEFGKKLITTHSSSASETRKQELQQDWETYVKEQQLSHAPTLSSIYSPEPSHDDIGKVYIRYDNANIKKILCEHYNITKDIDIDIEDSIEQVSDTPKTVNAQTDRIQEKLLLDMKRETAEKFYAIGIKNYLEGMTTAAIIHLLKQGNVFQIYIKPLMNYQYASGLNARLSENNEISKFIEGLPVKRECLTLIDYKELKMAKITEIFHVSINADCDLNSQQEEINKILDQDNSYYESRHQQCIISLPGTSSSEKAYPCKGDKDCTPIPGLPEVFSSYYQDQVAFLLQLRLEDAVPGVLKSVNVLEENYTLRKSNEDYIAAKLSSFIVASAKDTILMPLNIGGNHLVGIAVVKDGNNVVIHYMDSELNPPPESLFMQISAILESHDYSIELRITEVEKQKYSNCGPEVIENLTVFATGKPRASQEDAILKHSLVLERYLLKDPADSNHQDLSTSVAIFGDTSALNEKLIAQVQHYLRTGEAFDTARAAIEDGTVSIIRQSAVVSDEDVVNAIPLLPNADSYHDSLEALYPNAEFSQDYTAAIVGLLCSFVVQS